MRRPGQTREARLTLLGVGAMNSPRYRPVGLLLEFLGSRVVLDGGPGAEPQGRLDAWLVTDEHGELIHELRILARRRGIVPLVARYSFNGYSLTPRSVVHTSHPTYGYLLKS